MDSTQEKRRDYLICALLIVVTLAVYGQVWGFGFVNYDDDTYVSRNPMVVSGLNARSVAWAFTTNHAANWHPLTWLSLMLDSELSGRAANPTVFHVTNLLLHLANALLLFLLLSAMTGMRWRSAFVAALFAIHPLHVESVAWVAERKDVLSTFFWILTMLAYLTYLRKPGARRYALVLLAFALGLMAKPMLVSLPLVLLLMAMWKPKGREVSFLSPGPRSLAPLFLLAIASCILTIWAQHTGGAVGSLDVVPIGVRAANALVACVTYIGKMISPMNLAVFYPHPGTSLPIWQVIGSGLLIAGVSVLAIRLRRTRGYLTFGWFWYLVTLIPVIGLVQVGKQAMADRYTYVPLIGLFIMIAWGVPDLIAAVPKRSANLSKLAAALAVVVLLGLAVTTYFQVGYWRDTITLFEHAVNVTDGNYLAHNSLGTAYQEANDSARALEHYREAVSLRPGFADARYNLGVALAKAGNPEEAVEHYQAALASLPDNPSVRFNLGCALAETGHLDEAIEQFTEVIRLDPGHAKARAALKFANDLRRRPGTSR